MSDLSGAFSEIVSDGKKALLLLLGIVILVVVFWVWGLFH